MANTPDEAQEALARQQERAEKLAEEKSHLQLIIHMMKGLSAVPGLDNTVDNMLRLILNNIGGTDLILYYWVDSDLFRTDVFGNRAKLSAIEDDLVKKTFETRTSIEQDHDFSDTQMMTPEFTKARTLVYPLLVGSELIGILKLDGLYAAPHELHKVLPTFFNYAALILKSEILGHTKLKQANDRLKKSQALLDATGQMAKVGGWDLNVETKQVRWTRATYRIHDIPEGQTFDVSKAVLFFDEPGRAALVVAMQHCEENAVPYDMELPFTSANGRHLWTHTIGRAVKEDGKVVRLTGTIQDITERKEAEKTLRQSEAFLNALLDAMPTPVFYKDCEGRYIGCNPAFEQFLGRSRSDIIGKSVYDMAPKEIAEVYHEKDRELFAKPGRQTYDWCVMTRAGDRRDVVFHKATFKDAQGRVAGLIGAILDITERNRAEAERLDLARQLQEKQKLAAVGTLACGMGHEINNPIMGIINYAQLIKDRLQGKNEALEEFAGEIVIEAERIAGIVRGLSAFATRDIATRAAVPVSDLVESALSPTRAILTRDHITLAVDVPDNLPAVSCDRRQIEQVLTGLLSNARDTLNERYPGHDDDKVIVVSAELGMRNAEGKWERGTGNGERGARSTENGTHSEGLDSSSVPRSDFRVPTSVLPTSAAPSSEFRVLSSVSRILRLTVADHGTGIPDAVREHIFEPFFTTKDKSVGAGNIGKGLGLFVSFASVQEHGGALSVESEVGQWTRVHVDLPAQETRNMEGGPRGEQT